MDAVTLAAATAAARKNYGTQPQKYQRGLVPCATRVHAAMAFQDSSTSLSNGTDTSSFQRLKVVTTAAVSDLRMALANFAWGVAGPNQITVTAAIETATASYPLTFNGKAAAVLDPDAELISDPGCVPVTVPAGTSLWLRTYVSVGSAGQKWPQSAYYWQKNDDRVSTSTGDVTASTGAPGSLAPVYVRAFAPAAVLGVPATPNVPVFAIFGDSISVGMNDWFADTLRGWAERAMNGRYPYVNVSRHTSHVAHVVPAPAGGSGVAFAPVEYRQRWRLAAGCSHVLSAFGVNDVSDTLAVIQSNLLSHWTEMAGRGMKVWQYTLPPLANTSSDSWTTVAGQTASASNSKRVSLNAWFRAGAPIDPASKAAVAVGTSGALIAGSSGHPLRGYVETSDYWEDTRDSGKWKAPERSVTDSAITSGSGTLTSATANFTNADVGKSIVTMGAGAAGAVLSNQIVAVTNSTTVTVLNNASTTVTGAATFIGVWTVDGQHPSYSGHVAAGTGLLATMASIAAS